MMRRPRTVATRARRRRGSQTGCSSWTMLTAALVARRRGDHTRLGLALQLTTVRYLGTFLPDPLDVPAVVLERLAGQLEIADPSCVKRYTERRTTPFEHREEIKAAYGLREFSEAEAEFAQWARSRAWNTGQGPKTIFADGVQWLRVQRGAAARGDDAGADRGPGPGRGYRASCTRRWRACPCPHQRGRLEHLVVVPDGRAVLGPGALAQGPGEAERPEPGEGAEPGGRDRRRGGRAPSASTRTCRTAGSWTWPGTG